MAKSGITKIKVNSAGVIAVLKDSGVAGFIADKAQAIKSRLPTDNGEEWRVNQFPGRDRTQTFVATANTAARETAARTGALQSGLGAGR